MEPKEQQDKEKNAEVIEGKDSNLEENPPADISQLPEDSNNKEEKTAPLKDQEGAKEDAQRGPQERETELKVETAENLKDAEENKEGLSDLKQGAEETTEKLGEEVSLGKDQVVNEEKKQDSTIADLGGNIKQEDEVKNSKIEGEGLG